MTATDLGSSWRSGCPVAPSKLRRVRVDYWGYDGEVQRGDLIVHQDVAQDVADAFGALLRRPVPDPAHPPGAALRVR